jgi:hypothetical protein
MSSGDICAATLAPFLRRHLRGSIWQHLAPFLRRHLRSNIGAVPPATSARQHWQHLRGSIGAVPPATSARQHLRGRICRSLSISRRSEAPPSTTPRCSPSTPTWPMKTSTPSRASGQHWRRSSGDIFAATLAPFLRRHLRGSIWQHLAPFLRRHLRGNIGAVPPATS